MVPKGRNEGFGDALKCSPCLTVVLDECRADRVRFRFDVEDVTKDMGDGSIKRGEGIVAGVASSVMHGRKLCAERNCQGERNAEVVKMVVNPRSRAEVLICQSRGAYMVKDRCE